MRPDPEAVEMASRTLELAIQDYLRAVGEQRMLVDWVVCMSTVAAEDGLSTSRYTWATPPGGVAFHRVVGLLDTTRLLLSTSLASD